MVNIKPNKSDILFINRSLPNRSRKNAVILGARPGGNSSLYKSAISTPRNDESSSRPSFSLFSFDTLLAMRSLIQIEREQRMLLQYVQLQDISSLSILDLNELTTSI